MALLGAAMVLPAGVLAIGGETSATLADSATTASTSPRRSTTAGPNATFVSEVATSVLPDPAEIPPVVGVGGSQPEPPFPAAIPPPTTSRRPRVTATTPPVTVTRPPAGPSSPACGPSYLEATASSLRNEYEPGEQVALFGSIGNVSAQACTYLTYTVAFSINNDSNQSEVPVFSAAQVVDNGRQNAFEAAQSINASPLWSAATCDGDRCPPGQYTATFTWSFDAGPARTATATFRLAAPPTTTTSIADSGGS